MTTLTYDEWKKLYGAKLKDDGWQTAEDIIREFRKTFKLSLEDELEKINQKEFQLYLQRVNAGINE